LYWARTWIPDSPQPGPAGLWACADVNIGLGYNTGGGSTRAVILADYNNNGQSDFLYQEGVGGIWYARQYAPAAPQPGPNGAFAAETNTGYAGTIVIGDYNNDGLQDFITVDGNDRYRPRTFTQGIGETNSQFHENNGATGPAIILGGASGRPAQIADINNDGLQDFIYHKISNNTWYFRTYQPDASTPADFTDGAQAGTEKALINNDTLLIGDYNNDGLNDILFPLNGTWRAADVAADGTLGTIFDLGLSTNNAILAITNYNNSAAVPEPTSALLLGLGLLAPRRRHVS